MAAFIDKQQTLLIGREAEAEAKAEKAATEKAELRAELQIEHMRSAATQERLQAQQLEALQLRLQVLHAGKLLNDDELFQLEDMIADSLEASDCETGDGGGGGGGEVAKLVALSGRMAGDAALARQLRRRLR